MTSDRYDSVLISIDWLSFRYFLRRSFRAYIVVVTADTNGSIGVYESPETYSILHRPMREKPATIDFGFDGFVIYSTAGTVPDLVRFDVFVVKDRSKGRRAGAVQKMIEGSQQLEATVETARSAMASAASDGTMAASVAMAVSPVLDLVGGVVEHLEGKVIEAYGGSKIFDGAMVSKAGDEPRKRLNQAVVSPTGNIETKVDITLFQRQSVTSDPDAPEPTIPEPIPPEVLRPPQTTTPDDEPDAPPLDPDAAAISLRRPRILFRVGWLSATLVPIGTVLAKLFSESAHEVGMVAFLLVPVSIVLSPALIYGAGQWARVRLHKKGLTHLGRVALAFHLISLACVAIGLALFVAALVDELATGWDRIGKLIGAAIGAVIMVMISLIPWLVSVITGLVFGRRATRR